MGDACYCQLLFRITPNIMYVCLYNMQRIEKKGSGLSSSFLEIGMVGVIVVSVSGGSY